MAATHKKELEKQLWNIANALRGNMSADEFRDYILGFIFYKYLSEKMHRYADAILKGDGITFDSIKEESKEGIAYLEALKTEAIDQLGFFLLPSELFHVLAQKGEQGEFIIESLTQVLRHIEQSTMGSAAEDDFNGLFDDLDLTSNKLGKTEKAKNELISKVLGHLDTIDFCLDDTEIDVLGDAYEYLIGMFASGAGKKAGEFYTPQMVSKLLAKLVTRGKTRLKSVYDPTCGSGSLLLRVAKEVEEVGEFFGQESNPSTYNLARMNMILHDVHYSKFDIQQDDTLEAPHHTDKRFEAVVANPPFSANWSASSGLLTDERFADYGRLAPAGKADFAFVQHMFYQLDDTGTMAVVLPHGVLFRGAAEGHIRQFLIEQKNCLDAVIGLPENIFYGTAIPTCIVVLKKNRLDNEGILFIDSSAYFLKAPNQCLLRDEDIERILIAVEDRKNIEKFSYIASLDDIRKNDFNLNIPRYVDTFEDDVPVVLTKVFNSQTTIINEIDAVDKELACIFDALGMATINDSGLITKIFSDEIMFKDESGSAYPKWERKKVGDLFDNIGGTALEKYVAEEGTHKFISIGNYKLGGKYIDNGQKIVLNNKTKSKLLNKNDLVMVLNDKTKSGGILGTCLLIDKDDTYIYNQRSERLICGSEILPEYAWYYLNSAMFKKDIFSISQGGTQIYVNFPYVKKITIPVPSLSEQEKIVNLISLVCKKIDLLDNLAELTRTFKKGIFQQIFE